MQTAVNGYESVHLLYEWKWTYEVKSKRSLNLLWGSRHTHLGCDIGQAMAWPAWPLEPPLGHTWMFSISNDCYIIGTFFVWFRVALDIRLKGYGPRHARSFSDTPLCACAASPYIHPIAIWKATTPDSKAHVIYDCILHTKTMALLPTMHRL